MAVVCASLLAVCLFPRTVPAREGRAAPQGSQQTPQQQAPPQSSDPAKPAQAPATPSGFDDQLSIGRIRRQLEERGPLVDFRPKPEVPVYRVDVRGFRFQLPEWKANLIRPPLPVPQPFGGADYYEMMRLITPPEFWGSASLSNLDVLMQATTAAQTWAGKKLAKKALEMNRKAAANRLHNEVEREVADFVARSAGTGGVAGANAGAKAAAEAKKQDAKKKEVAEKKKQEEEKKKKTTA